MGSSGGGQTAPNPEDAARAQALAQQAGTMFNIATSPQQAYAEALNQIQFNPVFQRSQSATQNNSAMQNAAGNQAIMRESNPHGFSGTQSFGKYAGDRLADVTGGGMPQGLTPMNTAGAFDYPTMQNLPDFKQITAQAKQIGQALPNITFWKDNPYLTYPQQ